MRYIQIIVIFAFIAMFPKLGIAQQLPQFSQYMYNTISINPAYAGSREVMVINALHRSQWIGINGAPLTQTLSIHSSVPHTKFGVGLSAINDQLGYEKTTYIFSDVSYTLNLSDVHQLAFGLKVGASKYSLDQKLLNDQLNASDTYLNYINYKWNPNFGLGVYFRSDYFYMGLSAPKIVNYVNRNEIDYIPIERVSYYLNGGYLYEFYSGLKFKPTFLVKYTNGAALSVDLTANFLINDRVWVGAMYRYKDAIGGMINLKLSEDFSIGYAYDYTLSDLQPFSLGSHEIIINFEFDFPQRSRTHCPDLYN